MQSVHPCKSVIQTTYDIVKAHDGGLKVETKEGEGLSAGQAGSTFIIELPTV
jgi:signal transduction histidine kinase